MNNNVTIIVACLHLSMNTSEASCLTVHLSSTHPRLELKRIVFEEIRMQEEIIDAFELSLRVLIIWLGFGSFLPSHPLSSHHTRTCSAPLLILANILTSFWTFPSSLPLFLSLTISILCSRPSWSSDSRKEGTCCVASDDDPFGRMHSSWS